MRPAGENRPLKPPVRCLRMGQEKGQQRAASGLFFARGAGRNGLGSGPASRADQASSFPVPNASRPSGAQMGLWPSEMCGGSSHLGEWADR